MHFLEPTIKVWIQLHSQYWGKYVAHGSFYVSPYSQTIASKRLQYHEIFLRRQAQLGSCEASGDNASSDTNQNTRRIKPKFHYTDFATKSRTCRAHKSWKSATQITSPTFMICVCDFVANLSWTLSRTLSQTSRHVEMVCVRDFLRGQVSVKVSVMEFGL